MPFPWTRYVRRVGVVFVIALVISVAFTALLNGGRLSFETVLFAVTDSFVLAVLLGFPLTQRINRGPHP